MFYVYFSTAIDYLDDGINLMFHTRKLPVLVHAADHEAAHEKALDKAFAMYDDEKICVRIEAVVRMK